MTKNANDYVAINKKLWNKRTDFHVRSEFYDVAGFLNGKSSLNEIELDLIGNIQNKSVLHLQCHFGLDTISLARMGADVTGVDLSDKAITEARLLAMKAGVKAEFICSNLYDLPPDPEKKFDIVYSSYGTIGWLPDLNAWAKIISSHLKTGGRFIFAEFHPVVWMFDIEFQKVGYNYFNSGPIIETDESTYADGKANINLESVCWNHSLGEVIGNLLKNGIRLTTFNEYDYSPYNCFKNCAEVSPHKFRISHLGNKIPMVYSLTGEK
jgi:2-polyprenyl-3-methyl-5-hydroxy-6-metoxy-1,4-benzoquinol methylase